MDILMRRIVPLLFLFASIILCLKASHKVSVQQLLNFSFPSLSFLYQSQQTDSGCSLLPYDEYWIRSNRIVTSEGVFSGAVEVKSGRIASVVSDDFEVGQFLGKHVVDFGNAVVMPGLVDIHVHLDEPGRTEWEGFSAGTKAAAAGFWGGLVPENALNATALDSLLSAGVLGLKEGLYTLAKYKRPLLIHAEVDVGSESDDETRHRSSDPRSYSTYLKSRPASCAALQEGHIDMLSSDHSPSTPELKLLKEGDFLRAWGGVSSLQFDLPATWTYGQKYGITLSHLVKLWSEKPAKFAGQEHKGAIVTGNHADFVVWEPEVEFDLDDNYKVFSKNPSISAYMGKRLSGKVLATFVRGNLVFSDGIHSPKPCGETIFAK
ncbi:hypothetical protein KFK09_029114 [Dendrobium nobile]|uniref:Allantoinase n=1 Tax=Dendrobium nobile TaxID=94219 RepID=A0A8T3A531_DENNO|nr:hypothetical protein KFK09_029114 [Dendrobium nobile]